MLPISTTLLWVKSFQLTEFSFLCLELEYLKPPVGKDCAAHSFSVFLVVSSYYYTSLQFFSFDWHSLLLSLFVELSSRHFSPVPEKNPPA